MFFECTKRIRFSHCDPAGIIFYPRYIELFHEVVEDWFAEGIGVDFCTLRETWCLGVPAVRLELEFVVPSRYGELLSFRLEVESIGNSSMNLLIGAYAADELRARAVLTLVFTSMDDFRAVPIDDAWRKRLQPFLIRT